MPAAQGDGGRGPACTTRTGTAAAIPDGLKGEEIPLLGRIVSVADAFDAMTTDRPYSKAMTFEAALARLRFLAGKKFDAGCVDAIEKAAAAGELTPAKARRAAVVARRRRRRRGRADASRPRWRRRIEGPSPHVICAIRKWAQESRSALWHVVSSLAPAGARAQKAAGDPEARFNAGLNHLREGRAELAVEEFKKAVHEDDKNPYFHKGLGQAYARQRKFKEAVEAFRKALELNPYYVDVRNDLGTALILSGKRDEGKKEFLTAFDDPTNPTPEISARNLGRPTSRRRTTPRPSTGSASASTATKAIPTPTSAWPTPSSPPASSTRRSATLEAGAEECPQRRGHAPRPRARPTRGRAVSRRRGRASRRAQKDRERRGGPPRPPQCSEDTRPEVARSRVALRMPYQRILDELLRSVAAPTPRCSSTPRARSWSRPARCDQRHRLIGAYQGIALATARKTRPSATSIGPIDQFMLCRYAAGPSSCARSRTATTSSCPCPPRRASPWRSWHSALARRRAERRSCDLASSFP